jgi:hypothetical protein
VTAVRSGDVRVFRAGPRVVHVGVPNGVRPGYSAAATAFRIWLGAWAGLDIVILP